MYEVYRIINTIEEYGNCTVYVPSINNKKANKFYKFKVCDDGSLESECGIDIFDQVFYDGRLENMKATVIQTVPIKELDSLDSIIDDLLNEEVFYRKDLLVNVNRNQKKVETEKVAKFLYGLVRKKLKHFYINALFPKKNKTLIKK